MCARIAKSAVLATVLAAVAAAAWADGNDRERAQMLQMQQQLQRLQADNAALTRERSQLQDQAKEADKLKASVTQTGKELARVRAEAEDRSRDLERQRTEMAQMRQQFQEQEAKWKAAVDQRDELLQAAATEKRKQEGTIALLSERLKQQTGRADVCEVKHVQALTLGQELIDAYSSRRLGFCEPITGIWRVGQELRIQDFQSRLYETRLDVPPAASPSAPTTAPAAGAAASR